VNCHIDLCANGRHQSPREDKAADEEHQFADSGGRAEFLYEHQSLLGAVTGPFGKLAAIAYVKAGVLVAMVGISSCGIKYSIIDTIITTQTVVILRFHVLAVATAGAGG